MSYPKALFGYQEEAVAVHVEKLKSAHGARQLELACTIEKLEEDIQELEARLTPLRTQENLCRQRLKKIRQRIADLYVQSIQGSYETDCRLEGEEKRKLQNIDKKSEELESVRQTLTQLCQEIERLMRGFERVMEEKDHDQ